VNGVEFIIKNCPNLIHIDFSTYTYEYFGIVCKDEPYSNVQLARNVLAHSVGVILKSIKLIEKQKREKSIEFVLDSVQLTDEVKVKLQPAKNITYRVVDNFKSFIIANASLFR